jgi:AcrR family transcriptional regulator
VAPRLPLTPERIVEAAVAVADEGGLVAVSMRNVARALGVEAMSLYHHVANKDALLDALADEPYASIELPSAADPWRPAMARRASSARTVLLEHPWALHLLESRRRPGPYLLAHHEAVLTCLRSNGFSVPLAAHAFSLLDAYVYGFVLSELTLPLRPDEPVADFVAELGDAMDPERYPHLVEMTAEHVARPTYAYADEFPEGLELILDGLAGRLAADR